MTVTELQRVIRAADPSAVLVSARVLERVIQQACHLPALIWVVPHRKSWVVDRQLLFRHVEQDELNLEPDQLLPTQVILLVEPTAEELGSQPGPLLLKYWRRLFHASVHLRLEQRIAAGELSLSDIRTRIEKIGQTEFEEIRNVLVQDAYLPRASDEKSVYVEFAALFLELRFFAGNLLPAYFPGIRDPDGIEEMLAQDVDAAGVFEHTRLAGSPTPVVRTAGSSDEAHEFYWRLVRSADKAAQAGNVVRSAILRTEAARVAPVAFSPGTRADAEADLKRLTGQLQQALQLTEAEAGKLHSDLVKLLDKADQGRQPVEAAILYDLQKACLDYERDIYTLDLVEWGLSGGKRPIKRPLPGLKLVRVYGHLRGAVQRLTMARLSEVDRRHLTRLLQGALVQSEERLRERFRPVLSAVLEDVGLHPRNPPEAVAFHKMVEELLDRVKDYGFLTFGDLRDAIARNQLKLPDLADPQDFIRGDPLIRLDRRLSTLMDGVYRPSEIYVRWLERLTSLCFGTASGRLMTRFVLVPFGAAFLAVELVKLILGFMGGLQVPAEVSWPVVGTLGFFLLALLQSRPLRAVFAEIGRTLYRPAHTLLVDLPLQLVRVPWLVHIVNSWPMHLIYWWLLKPLLFSGILWLLVPATISTAWAAVGTFLGVSVLLNSRTGHAVGEAFFQGFVNLVQLLGSGLVTGLVQWVLRGFKRITDWVEHVLFSVDEWLRFRRGDSRPAMVVRTLLGVLWFPISYVTRFYFVVLIEPGINPIKLPISILAAKFVYPMLLAVGLFDVTTLSSPLVGTLSPFLGSVVAWMLVIGTFYFLPDAFGFLIWEMKNNWRLYQANRPALIGPVVLGTHGETVRRLLQRGFHSGTVPRLYARLRTAERRAYQTGSWRPARTARKRLDEVAEAIRRWVERELLPLLEQGAGWTDQHLAVGRVALATNRIGIELEHDAHPGIPFCLEFKTRAGWLVASIRERGWLDNLPREQLRTLLAGIVYLYKLAGVHLVREQVRSGLPQAAVSYDVTGAGLILWLDQRHGSAIVYDLWSPTPQLVPRTPTGRPAPAWPTLEARRIIFGRIPLSWPDWVQSWERAREGAGYPVLPCPELDLSLLGQLATTAVQSKPLPEEVA
jgi:hypothetical protein